MILNYREALATMSSITTLSNWLFAFLVSKYVIKVEDDINRSGLYWLFGGIMAVGTLFVLFLVPETKGKTPEDMKRHFQGVKSK